MKEVINIKPIELLDEIKSVCDALWDDFCEDNGYEWADRFIDRLSCEICVSSGASKLVIIPKHENFVLKIPFFGRTTEEWVENADYTLKSDDPNFDWDEAGRYEYTFTKFEWAAVREGDDRWDYCAAETSIYEMAIEEGLESYFAAEYLLGFIDETPVYVQDKVCPCEEASISPYRSLNSEENKVYRRYLSQSSPAQNHFPANWSMQFIKVYGEDELTRLINFLNNHRINTDWHAGNLAYIEDDPQFPVPILLDYSNYNDQEQKNGKGQKYSLCTLCLPRRV